MLTEDKALQTPENTDDCDKGRVDGSEGRLGRVMVDLEIGSSMTTFIDLHRDDRNRLA